MDITHSKPRATWLYPVLALTFSLLWASAFMGVKIGLKSSPPFFLMGFRFLIAGAVLLTVARLRKVAFPATPRQWLHLGVIGLLNNACYLGLSAVALGQLTGGMGAILASTNPLLLSVVAFFLLRERLSPVKVTGLLVAFGSVIFIMYSRVGGNEPAWAMGLILLANFLMVCGTVLFKRWAPKQDLMVINGVQLLVSSLALLPISLALEPMARIHWNGNLLGALAFLAFGISCGAMLIWFYLLRSGDASRASAFFFLNPVFGLFLGALLLGEPLHVLDFVGSAGVALGIWLVQRTT